MTDAKQAKRGRPRKPGKTPFNFRLPHDLRQRLVESAEKAGHSLTEEAEFRLRRDFGWEATKQDIEEIKRDAIKWRDAEQLTALRFVGLQILRETEGRPTRLIVDLQSLLAEADGIARGLRAGFINEKAPISETRPMTPEEERQIDDIKRQLDAAKERLAAEDAAAAGKDDKVA
jgi:hypothetical protein